MSESSVEARKPHTKSGHLPCPFCGSERQAAMVVGPYHKTIAVGCLCCGAWGPCTWTGNPDAEALAWAAWDGRDERAGVPAGEEVGR